MINKNKKLMVIISMFLIFLGGLVNATNVNTNYINLSNSNLDDQLVFSNFTTNFTLTLSSDIQDYVSLDNPDIFTPGGTGTNVRLKSNIEEDVHESGYILYSGGYILVDINYDYDEPEIATSKFISFPEAKNFEYEQGDTYNEELKLRLSSSYPNSIRITDIDFSPVTSVIREGNGLETGVDVQPGDAFIIPLIIDTTEAGTGSYNPVTVTVEYDDGQGEGFKELQSTISLYVSSGVSPITGDTFSTKPTCSLSATTFNLNATYSFTCSGVVSNLEINIPSSEFWVGKNVEVSSGLYRYDFVPIKYGETKFNADFKYKGASIFSPFSQDVRITSAGSLVAGTTLKLIFTPKLDEATGDEDKFLIQLADNKTGSLVLDPRIWVNAFELNSSTDTFEFAFESNTDYEIRGKSPGYEDIVETINIVPQKINIKINPGSGDTSTMFNITTSVENATLTIGTNNYSHSYYGVLPEGVIEITAKKEGYKTEIINFTVGDRPRIISFGGEFKKGVQQNFTLNKNASWTVYYKKSLDTQEKTEFSKGNGNLINFTPDKKGVYTIEADGINIGTYEIPGFSFKDKWLGLSAWIWVIIGIIILFVIFVIVFRNKRREGSYGGGQRQDDLGLSFNVGDD